MDEACWIIIAGGEVSAMTDQTRDGKKAPAEHLHARYRAPYDAQHLALLRRAAWTVGIGRRQ